MIFLKPEAEQILKQIRLLILDVDGVLTDGYITYNDSGHETKRFNVKDGLGLRLLKKAGIDTCIATGRRSNALHHRCRDMGIDLIFEGLHYKAAILDDLVEKTGVSLDHMAFMGDDLIDLSLMHRVAMAVAVAEAPDEVIQAAHAITITKGGQGAVREVCDAILKAQGKWVSIVTQIQFGKF